ncbi:hypothetical protein H5410_057675 [Solanum commersonii]|uniref:Uncharacterized protein n=1 Tax=Solanum commersonii TaxID=4109 RepID=A0A9J5WQE8_SOLCO|nr:hypothetical protein H5410_057675 [Solanum commersonii]
MVQRRWFTWTNGHVYSRIDRALVNAAWTLRLDHNEVMCSSGFHAPSIASMGHTVEKEVNGVSVAKAEDY